MSDELSQPEPQRPPRRRWGWVAAIGMVFVLIVGAAWWLTGRRVWTDDATIRRAAGDRELREVLWTRPQALGDAFNTEAQEYEPSISPDGTEVYFVRGKPAANADVYVSHRRDGAWTEPEPLASINTDGDELGPRLTPDGRFLLFYSNRSGGIGQYDIWAAARVPGGPGGEFAQPFNLGHSVNSEFNEYSPAPTPDGAGLLFATNRKSALSEQRESWRATVRQNASGDYDIFLAALDASGGSGIELMPPAMPPIRGAVETSRPIRPPTTTTTHPGFGPAGTPSLAYQAATELQGVNTPHHEGASCVSPVGDFLYFASNRPGGLGKFDIYRGRLRQGVVSAVENLGPAINSPDNEADPQLALGGFHLLFSSDGPESRGGYDLMAAESREVYPDRDGRPLPAFGRNGWLLLLGILALLPLLYYLRGWDDHRLNLLQKCLLLSVLFHVVLTIVFSLYTVSRDIVQYVKRQQEMELAVDLRTAGIQTAIASEIRGQPRLDVPVQAPAPSEVSQTLTDVPLETMEPLDAGELSVPQAQLDPGRMVVEVPAPRAAPATPPESLDVVAAAPPTPQLPEFELRVPLAPVSAPEKQTPLPAAAPQADAGRMEVPVGALDAPDVVQVDVRPTEIVVSSLAEAVADDGDLPREVPDASEVVAAALPEAPAGPELEQPAAMAQPIAGAEETLPEPGETETGLQRQGVAVAVEGPLAVSADAPLAELAAARESLASAPEMKREIAPSLDAVPVTNNDAATADRVDITIDTAFEKVALRPSADAAEPAQPALPMAGRAEAGDEEGVAAQEVAVGAEPARPDARADALRAAAGPTTRPSVIEAADSPVSPELAMGVGVMPAEIVTTRLAKAGGDAEVEPAALETVVASEKLGPSAEAVREAMAAVNSQAPVAPTEERPEQSLAAAPQVAPLMVTEDARAAEPTVAAEAPNLTLPAAAAASPKVAAVDSPDAPPGATETALMLSVRTDLPDAAPQPASLRIDPTQIPVVVVPPKPADALAAGAGVMPRAEAVDVSVGPQLSVTLPELTAPEAMFQRSQMMRKPLVEKLGGTKESEEAVERGLAFLARQQEPDGHWTRVDDPGPPGKRGKGPHDMACTGLSVLAFLAADHTPAKAGPYRDVVEKGLDFLLATQGSDGDLRGYPERRGGGSGAANLYDHGIACLALGEAGLMTGDKRYIEAAIKGAAFTVACQHPGTGGWRYTPGEPGDTSVFGWQIMALHSAEQLGFEMPAAAREGVERYVKIASAGPRKMLGGYTPGSGPTPAMTAELLFARILLGGTFDEADVKEAGDYLNQHPPAPGGDVYGWYYASLSLIQMENDAWRTWNERCRETLVKTQRKEGPFDGSWDTNLKWGDHGGRIYTTAMATLTLEVYYRYLPMVQKK